MLGRLRSLGPGLLVAAAFIGPGTVTTASVAGASTGYALLWALVFSIFAVIILQEMSARLGIVSREGLGEALRTTFDNPLIKALAVVLIVTSLVRSRLGHRSWRRVHWLAYACWPIGLAHGLGIGTDRDTIWVFALTICCAAAVAAAATWRLVTTARAGAR